MIVNLTVVPPAVGLMEPEDCGRFDVIVQGPGDGASLHDGSSLHDSASLDRALAGASVGRVEDGEALVNVAAVRRLASGVVDDGWDGDFRAMLDYARGKGWLTEDGDVIRAHVEWR